MSINTQCSPVSLKSASSISAAVTASLTDASSSSTVPHCSVASTTLSLCCTAASECTGATDFSSICPASSLLDSHSSSPLLFCCFQNNSDFTAATLASVSASLNQSCSTTKAATLVTVDSLQKLRAAIYEFLQQTAPQGLGITVLKAEEMNEHTRKDDECRAVWESVKAMQDEKHSSRQESLELALYFPSTDSKLSSPHMSRSHSPVWRTVTPASLSSLPENRLDGGELHLSSIAVADSPLLQRRRDRVRMTANNTPSPISASESLHMSCWQRLMSPQSQQTCALPPEPQLLRRCFSEPPPLN